MYCVNPLREVLRVHIRLVEVVLRVFQLHLLHLAQAVVREQMVRVNIVVREVVEVVLPPMVRGKMVIMVVRVVHVVAVVEGAVVLMPLLVVQKVEREELAVVERFVFILIKK
jgi:hypothetical protein